MPQIEVNFDLDANGILSVTAKDKATGKEQSIRIEGQGGLSDSEIETMVSEAEAAAEEDRRKLEEVEARNKLDTLVYQTQKMVNENKDKLSEETLSSINGALEAGQSALDSGDNLTSAFEDLQSKLHAASSELYQASQESEDSSEEDVVDVEYEEAG